MVALAFASWQTCLGCVIANPKISKDVDLRQAKWSLVAETVMVAA